MAVLPAFSAAVLVYMAHGARKVRRNAIQHQDNSRNSANNMMAFGENRGMDLQGQFSTTERVAYLPHTPGDIFGPNVSQGCQNSTWEVFVSFWAEMESCSQKPSHFKETKCACVTWPRVLNAVEKMIANPESPCKNDVDAVAQWLATDRDALRPMCWLHTSVPETVCQTMTTQATSPLEERDTACISRAGSELAHHECLCELRPNQIAVYQALLQIPEATQCTQEELGETVRIEKLTTLQTCGGIEFHRSPCWAEVYDAALQEEMSSCVKGFDWQHCDCQLAPKILAANEEILSGPGQGIIHCAAFFGDARARLQRHVDALRKELTKCG